MTPPGSTSLTDCGANPPDPDHVASAALNGQEDLTAGGSGSPAHSDLSDVELREDLVGDDFLRLIPRDFARAHLIVSQGKEDNVEKLAISEHTDPAVVFNTGVKLGSKVQTHLADAEVIARIIDEAFGRNVPGEDNNEEYMSDAPSGGEEIDRLLARADRDLLSTQGKAPVIKLVDAILFEALQQGASDVHLQPLAEHTLVRYRLDGVLHTARELPGRLTSSLVSRIKVMGRMDITERRLPQDGRTTVTISSRSIDLRISTLPTSYGERVVIRLLDNSNHLCDFPQLGMPPEVSEKYLDRARRTTGIILLTGPTGSGKTTTLYATLRRIGSPDINIMTIEDPIEYELSSVGLAISQSQINPRKGVTFATGLRHILRQDPDVVMVGEVRDAETARIAIQSSLTGHLVFSTLHTNDAPSAVMRLIDLGVEPYLVGASLSAVMAQRLLRKVHRDCAGQGCEICFDSGFRGRTGLFELMVIDETLRALVCEHASLAVIGEAARKAGMRTLAEEGERVATEGQTTALEVRRVVQGACE